MNRYLLGLVMAVTTTCAAQAQAPPVAAFARLPAVTQAAISPNGQTIAILGGGPVDRTITFNVIDQPGFKGTKLGNVETVALYWAGDDYAIARIGTYDTAGPRSEVRLLRNAVVDRDGKFKSFLLQGDPLSSQLINHRFLGATKASPPRIMVMGLYDATGPDRDMNTRMARKGADDTRVLGLYAADPVTGNGSLVERGDFDTASWEVDLAGEARVLNKIDDIKSRRALLARPKGSKRWTLIQEGDDGREFKGYSDVDDALYFTKRTDAGLQLHRLRLATSAVEPVGKPLPEGDMTLVWDSNTNGVVGIRSWGEATVYEWLEAPFSSAYGTLTRAFKGKTVTLRSWSEDRTRFLATVEAADVPTAWYLYDRTRKEISPIGDEYPELAEAKLGTTTLIKYKARDGLEIPAYLTLPPGASSAAKAPLVVLPHDQPSSRDTDDFDYIGQFLASRGYAVLRPQYRGSAGFGQAHEDAGKGEWGGKIQTDIVDGVEALTANPAVDAGRTCVVGVGFGGYAALWGAVFEPKPYRCAVSVGGIADLGFLINEWGSDFGRNNRDFERFRDHVRATAPEGLSKVSPLKNASRAGTPILLIHGAQDAVAGPLHSREMNEALRKAGKQVEYVEIAGENHYLHKTASRTIVLEKLEVFLGKHLGVAGGQPATPADR